MSGLKGLNLAPLEVIFTMITDIAYEWYYEIEADYAQENHHYYPAHYGTCYDKVPQSPLTFGDLYILIGGALYIIPII